MAAFREPYMIAAQLPIKYITYNKLNKKLYQLDNINQQRLKAIERRQKEQQSELIYMLSSLLIRGAKKEGSKEVNKGEV